jgi:nucleoid DNA-binding protein
MDKYLLEILKDVNTIIIPGLGALTITNADKGEIMFMSYLKHDDGKLTSYIAEKEGMDENEAKNLVAKYVREIQIELDKGESYDMYQFGSFYKNDGEIDFKSWAQMNQATNEEVVKPVTSPKKPEVKKEEEIKADDNILIPTPPKEDIPEVKKEEPKVVIPPIEVKQETVTPPVKPTIKKEPLKENVYVAPGTENKELNILEKEERVATAAKLEKLRQEQEDKNKKKKRGIGFYILLAMIALLLGGGTIFGINYDTYKQHIPFLADKNEQPEEEVNHLEEMEEILNGEITETENDPEEEQTSEEEIATEGSEEIVEEVIEDPVVEENPIVNSNNGNDLPFHIIAGAFSSEANANRLGDKLRNEGYSVKVGKGRGMNLVSIKSFETRAQAQAALTDLKSVAPNGWVYEWK